MSLRLHIVELISSRQPEILLLIHSKVGLDGIDRSDGCHGVAGRAD